MLGSIEELEKDIELFQQNMVASGELQMLLKQMLEQIKQQNSEFGTQSSALISRVDTLPFTIENANILSNNRVKNDVAAEIDRALQSFANEQSRYLQGLEQTKQQVQSYIEQSQSQERTFSDKTMTIVTKVDGIPAAVEAKNLKSNAQIKSDVETALQEALQQFADEQAKYLQAIENMKQQIQELMNLSNAQGKAFADGVDSAIAKFDESAKRIIDDNSSANAALKGDIDKLLAGRNAAFAEEQNKYLASLQQTQSEIKNCESQLTAKYTEFIDTLQKLNISNLYAQNIQLKNELNKRTTILMVISVISVIIGIVGIIL